MNGFYNCMVGLHSLRAPGPCPYYDEYPKVLYMHAQHTNAACKCKCISQVSTVREAKTKQRQIYVGLF